MLLWVQEGKTKLKDYLAVTSLGSYEHSAERIMSGFSEKKGEGGKTKTFKNCQIPEFF